MKKSLKYYIVSWLVFVGLFHIICFVTPDKIGGASKYTGSFWIGYVFAIVAFVIHFVFMWRMLNEKNEEKRHMNEPLTYISIGELLFMIVVSAMCTLIPSIPNWIGIIICYGILVFSILFLTSGKIAGEHTVGGNKRLNEKVSLFRTMTDDAMNLISIANSKEEKQIAQKVYEVIRYSDPVSCEELLDIEMELQRKLYDLSVSFSEHTEICQLHKQAEGFINLAHVRNNRCKSLKRKL